MSSIIQWETLYSHCWFNRILIWLKAKSSWREKLWALRSRTRRSAGATDPSEMTCSAECTFVLCQPRKCCRRATSGGTAIVLRGSPQKLLFLFAGIGTGAASSNSGTKCTAKYRTCSVTAITFDRAHSRCTYSSRRVFQNVRMGICRSG